MTEIFVGFDSAWTDNVKAPGAICAISRRAEGFEFIPPRLARFAEAGSFIEALTNPDGFMLIALDQPTRVPNAEGGRPAERVAASVISRLGGGVQPARRTGGGASTFGEAAPLWPFLSRLQATEDPYASRSALTGRHLIEVFPALALPSMIPSIWQRGRAAKYNPVTSTHKREDWPLVCLGAAYFAEGLGVGPVSKWLSEASQNREPTKSDQDRLDAVLCLLVALQWRLGPPDASMLIGDLRNGYIVAPVIEPVAEVLRASASVRGVPINDPSTRIAEAPYAHSPVMTAPPRRASETRALPCGLSPKSRARLSAWLDIASRRLTCAHYWSSWPVPAI